MSSRASSARKGTRAPTASPAPSANSQRSRGTRASARLAGQVVLPGLATQHSTAYGSSPKLGAATGLNPDAGAAGFAAAFNAHEPTILEEPALEHSSPLLARSTRRGPSSPPVPGPFRQGTEELASPFNINGAGYDLAAGVYPGPQKSSFPWAALFFWLLLGACGLVLGLSFVGRLDGALGAASSLAATALGPFFSSSASVSAPLASLAPGQVQPALRGIDMDFVNFFSPGAGAVVDPRLTSPSMFHWKEPGEDTRFPLLPFPVSQAGPTAALTSWLELGDCWCTSMLHVDAPDTAKVGTANPFYEMKGQLAVSLGQAIYPDRVVVEGPPAAALADPTARPEELSLWVEIEDAEQRRNVWAAVLGVDPSRVDASRPTPDDAPPAPSGWRKVLSYLIPGPAPPASLALGETWVRVGQTSPNDRFSATGRQIDLAVDLEAMAVPVTRTVLRVDSNFGQAYSCLYRVLLGGKPAM